MPVQEIVRAYRFALDPTPAQTTVFARHAGASRWARNHALALKQTAHRAWTDRRDAAVCELAGWTTDDLSHARHATKGSDLRKQLAGYQKQAGARIKPDLEALGADTRLWDHHRKIVFKWKTSGSLANGTAQQEAAYAKLVALNPALAAELEQRRTRVQSADDFTAARKTELATVRTKLVDLKVELIEQGALTPGSFDIQSLWRATRDQPKEDGGSPWWTDLNVYAFLSGFDNADRAWKNWVDSCTGKRKGRPVGYPRFKRKGSATDSFTLYHDVKNPGIRLNGYRGLLLPTIGPVRLHNTSKRLARLVNKGHATISSVTVSRNGHRWYVSVLARVQQNIPVIWRHTGPDGTTDHLTPDAAHTAQSTHGGTVHQIGRPTARQRVNGLVAADLGSQPLAQLSAPLDPGDPATATFANPKHLVAATDALTRAQRALSRCTKRSKNRRKAVARLARIHHQVATRRATHQHGLTKKLATLAGTVALEDLDLTALTATGRGTVDAPGTNVKVRATFNRHLLDAGLGEIRRQLTYKTSWYGSTLVILDKGEATSTKCSRCGERNTSSHPSDKHFACAHCGLDVSRRTNAVRSIYKAARRKTTSVAPEKGSTLKAPGGPVSPAAGDGDGHGPLKGEGPPGPADPPPR